MERREWNFAALIGGFIVVSVNAVGAYAFLSGKMTLEQWAASTGAINGVAIGWVGRAFSAGGPVQ